MVAALLHGDLETIVLKALEKEPNRRYQNIAALSHDIERHLADQPIIARPPSAAYHLRKLVARHKVPVMFAVGSRMGSCLSSGDDHSVLVR